jgi:predicted nucleic acid-binding protein
MLNVVVNSTPLIALHSIGRLDILSKMYGCVYIPHGVYEEVSVDGDIEKDAFIAYPNFQVRHIANENARRYFKTALHKGEVEVMILADEVNADICIIDDKLAREYAKHLGLKLTGTLGMLVKAKSHGWVGAVTPLMDTMLQNGIYISNTLYASIKKLAGE